MMNTSVSDRTQRNAVERLSDACNHLIATYTRGPSWLYPQDEAAFELLFNLAKSIERERLIPVYRHHQPTMWSKCLLANPCETCAPHRECKPGGMRCRQCVRGKRPECPLAEPAPPAFTVTKTAAIKLVRLGLAEFVNSCKALRLTFSRAMELRGSSCTVDEGTLLAYALGQPWARAVIDRGWQGSSKAKDFLGMPWPVTYGEACCAWPR
jgi:hypothetical protein